MPALGAHVSIAGGLSRSIDRGLAIGAECLQIFASSPRQWRPLEHSESEVIRFQERRRETGIAPIFVHTIYLLSFASQDAALRERSIDSLALTLALAERLALDGVITHLGSAFGQDGNEAEERVARALAETLERAPGSCPLLLETASGGILGGRFDQLGRLIRALGDHPRLAVCLDTAHVFAAGYGINTAEGLETMLAEFHSAIGLDRLIAIHANDSKKALGSGVDRHANIGFGLIGEEPFARLLRHPDLAHLPFILEVPGMAGKGPDAENMAILRRLAGRDNPVLP